MAENWKQVWDDIRNALRGGAAPPEAPRETTPDSPPAARDSHRDAAPNEAAAAVIGAVEPAQDASVPPLPAMGDDAVGAVPLPDSPQAPMTTEVAPIADVPFGQVTEDEATAASPAAIDLDASPLAEPSGPIEDRDITAEGAADAADSATVPVDTQPTPLWRRHGWNALIVLLLGVALVNAFYRFDGARLWAQWTAPKPPAPDVVATFDGGRITTTDLEAHVKTLLPDEYREVLRSSETLRLLVQEMATDELARRWALERKVDADQTFQHTMEHITENANLGSFSDKLHNGGVPVAESDIQAYYEKNKAEFGDQTLGAVREQIRQRLAGEKESQYVKDYIDRLKANASITRDYSLLDVPEPSDAEPRAYYEANTQSYTVTAQFSVDLLTIPFGADETAARVAADKALLKLRAGESFGVIPAQVAESQVISATVVPAGALGAEWDAAVKALQPGEISDVIRTGSGFSIARLIQVQPARTLTFEEVRPQVLEQVRRQRIESWMKDNGSKTLFMLKSKQYTLGQFYKEYQELPLSVQQQFAGAKGMKDLADRLIERLLLVEDTYDQLLQVKNKDVIDQTRLDVLKQMLEQQEVDDKIQVSEEELQQYYDQNQALMTPPPTVRIRYIRIGLGTTDDEQNKARARADEAYKKLVPGLLQQGADFAAIAKEYSEDPETAAKGGELPIPLGETNNPLEPPELHEIHKVVLDLPVNQISPPFEVGDSLYIVQPIERTQPKTLTFEEAKPYIKEALTNQKHDELLRQLQDRLAKQAKLVIYDSAIQAYYERSTGAGGASPTSGP